MCSSRAEWDDNTNTKLLRVEERQFASISAKEEVELAVRRAQKAVLNPGKMPAAAPACATRKEVGEERSTGPTPLLS